MAQLGRKENQVAKGDLERQDCLAQLGSRDLQGRKENPGRKVTQEWRFRGCPGQRGLLELRGSKVFLDQRGKQDKMEQKERRVSKEKKETEVLWDYPVLQDQLEFQALRDQRARGAAKVTLG